MGKRSWSSGAAYLVFLGAAILLLAAIRVSNERNRTVTAAFVKQATYSALGQQLAAGSDLLTNEVRKYVVTTDRKHLDNYWEEINVTRSRDKVLEGLRQLNTAPEDVELLARAKANSDALVNTETRGMKLILVAQGASMAGIPAAVVNYKLSPQDAALPPQAKLELARRIQFDAQYDRDKALIMNPIAEFQTRIKQKTASEVAVAQQAASRASNILLISGLLAITAMTLAFTISSWLSKQRATRIEQAVGDLALSSGEILAAIETHEMTVAQQAASVHETTSTMDEFEASFRQTKTLVDESSRSTQDARRAVDLGQKAVEMTMGAFGDLQQKVAAIGEHIMDLSEQTSQIHSISHSVREISAQTNMLALNAAVEAARAGSHGKGFAVVASEIRKLADQSKASAERITTLVEQIQKATTSTVMATETGSKTVEGGIRLAGEMHEAFAKITVAIDDAYNSAQTISISIEQESLAVRQVLEAMNAINDGASETASGISRTQESLHRMSDSAKSLASLS